MKVFISWSGTASRDVAIALRDWFPKVLQGIDAFVSAKDIDKGANWSVELGRELADTEFGVVCLTPENLSSPWLNYEAGAITRSVDSRVCPVLHGVSKGDVRDPMAQLQMTEVSVEDFKLLMGSMNKAAGSPLGANALNEAVEVWWTQLDAIIGKIDVVGPSTAVDVAPEPKKPESTMEEMVTEVLHRVRDLDGRLHRVERHSRTSFRRDSNFENHRLRNELLGVLSSSDVEAKAMEFMSGGVRVEITEPLPEPFPESLYRGAAELARVAHKAIHLVGSDRTVSFDASGSTDEPPF